MPLIRWVIAEARRIGRGALGGRWRLTAAALMLVAGASAWGLHEHTKETLKSSDRAAALSRARPVLDWADRETLKSVDQSVGILDRFFADAKGRSGVFARESLSWGSKWRLVADKLPFTRTDRHEEFLKAQFNECLFTPQQMQQAVEQVVASFADSAAGIENQMLVRLRADIAGLPEANLPIFREGGRLREAFDAAIAEAAGSAGSELKGNVSREVITSVVAEVLTQVAVRLGVSAGILGVGAASSWATLGIGAVVGLIVDQIVSWAWDRLYDPVEELTGKIDRKLDEVRVLIIHGDGMSPGLKPRLEDLAAKRSALRRRAVMELLGLPENSR